MTRRLLLSYLSLTLFVLLLLELPLAVFFQQRETDRLTADVERDAAVMATIFEDSLEAGTTPDPGPAEDYTARTGARVVVVDTAGISLLDTEADSRRDFSTRPEFEQALSGVRSQGTRNSETLGTELLYVAVPVASGGRVHGALRLTFDTSEVQQRVRAFWWGLVAVGGVILVVVAGFGWGLSRSITSPIRKLQASAARFSRGDLAPAEALVNAPVELTDLEGSMNVMAARLDRLLTQQRAFVADASHQLRTPLTALQLRLENLRSDVDGEQLQADVDATIGETQRLAHLVTDLLHLASAERIATIENCDLVAVATERISTWTELAALSGVQLRLVGALDEPAVARCVVGGVEQILDNLLSNAIEASPPDSLVEVEIERGAERHSLSVVDQGPGLSDEQRELALERFWRADVSTPGTGLGLAIVRSLAEASGGSVQLSAATPHGIRATLRFPSGTGRVLPTS